MGQPASSYNWTTLDEINYVRHIALGFSHIPLASPKHIGTRDSKARIIMLRAYIAQAQKRNWKDEGMRVDPHAVILHAMECLDELQGTLWRYTRKRTPGDMN